MAWNKFTPLPGAYLCTTCFPQIDCPGLSKIIHPWQILANGPPALACAKFLDLAQIYVLAFFHDLIIFWPSLKTKSTHDLTPCSVYIDVHSPPWGGNIPLPGNVFSPFPYSVQIFLVFNQNFHFTFVTP